jgi:hypothetical protein
MSSSLFDRQRQLVEHLTSNGAIFGEGDLFGDAFGFHSGILHLEAKFSHRKRMEKIEGVLPRTLALLGARRDAIVRAFVQKCAPTSIGYLDNARQFADFLGACWRQGPREPAYLPDLAAFEIAYAAAVQGKREVGPHAAPQAGAIRRHPALALLRTKHDITAVLEASLAEFPAVAEQRETHFALMMPEGKRAPVAQRIPQELFRFLELLDDFVPAEEFAEVPDMDAIISHLAERGFIEVYG